MQKTFNITSSSIYPLGVCFIPEGLHIALVCEDMQDSGILLFDKKHKDGVKIPFFKEFRKGNIYSILLKGYHDTSCSYLFYHGEELYQDPYARALDNDRKYGELTNIPSRCKVYKSNYDWEDDNTLSIPYEDSIFYMLHVRGFTKHRSSEVRNKGTYAGIVEKIPYLKELGITAVLLMPSYEFDEVFHEDKQYISMEDAAAAYKELPKDEAAKESEAPRINYWGYQEGLYFLPKNAYAASKDAITEFKDMVKALHKNGIEVMMQFYLPPTLTYVKILEILYYWLLEYHIDGFQLIGVDIPMQMICKEPLLAETKLLSDKDIRAAHLSESVGTDANEAFRNFGYMNDAFLYDIRKLLKGDANMINNFMYLFKNNATNKGIINYIAKQDGFRLADLVSYNDKHNEANGEDNKDGNSYNFSWNCGIEGKSRKKGITNIRMRQMKNALTFVLLAQGTPLIYSGDEFGNTQDGNNNPYCQDNAVCWIKWNMLKTNETLFNYTKELINLRKNHGILHSSTPLRGIDYISCGYPDISFHGKEAWRPDTSFESRSLGVLYCGCYGNPDKTDDSYIYIGINMHWEAKQFGLPKMPKDLEWVKLFSTDCGEHDKKSASAKKQDSVQKLSDVQSNLNIQNFSDVQVNQGAQNILIPSRTIMIYHTKKRQESNELTNKSSGKSTNKNRASNKNKTINNRKKGKAL
ncbi:MAG: hypothetical protein K2K46_11255 [Lachnospiraceae bacterium]|nr:hypothetical protein [Lachnospiraceae bacterium]